MAATEPTAASKVVDRMLADRGPVPDHVLRSIGQQMRKALAARRSPAGAATGGRKSA